MNTTEPDRALDPPETVALSPAVAVDGSCIVDGLSEVASVGVAELTTIVSPEPPHRGDGVTSLESVRVTVAPHVYVPVCQVTDAAPEDAVPVPDVTDRASGGEV